MAHSSTSFCGRYGEFCFPFSLGQRNVKDKMLTKTLWEIFLMNRQPALNLFCDRILLILPALRQVHHYRSSGRCWLGWTDEILRYVRRLGRTRWWSILRLGTSMVDRSAAYFFRHLASLLCTAVSAYTVCAAFLRP